MISITSYFSMHWEWSMLLKLPSSGLSWLTQLNFQIRKRLKCSRQWNNSTRLLTIPSKSQQQHLLTLILLTSKLDWHNSGMIQRLYLLLSKNLCPNSLLYCHLKITIFCKMLFYSRSWIKQMPVFKP